MNLIHQSSITTNTEFEHSFDNIQYLKPEMEILKYLKTGKRLLCKRLTYAVFVVFINFSFSQLILERVQDCLNTTIPVQQNRAKIF